MSHIKKVEISKLFGELDINWTLDPKVNILIGKNGSGKTALLRLIKNFMMSSHGIFLASGMESIRIELDENKYIYASKDSQANKPVKPFDDVPLSGVYRVESNIFPKEKKNNFSEVINLCYINTFEMSLEDFDVSGRQKGVETDLDVVLEHLINDWKSYLLKLKILAEEVTVFFDEKIRQISSKESADDNDLQELKNLLNDKTDKIDDINFYKNRFIEQINALFSDSKKRIDFDKNNAIIFRNHNGKSLSVYELSSGEKQMLIILLNVLIQENQPSIILMDEPENSLHLAWQHELIDIIQSLNDNCQLIIVTHAAGVFSKGWQDKITKMADITTGQSS
jgi:ABC-type cobalamin/Fe3+-siderophores transport system ATPase subunit